MLDFVEVTIFNHFNRIWRRSENWRIREIDYFVNYYCFNISIGIFIIYNMIKEI